MSLEGRLADLSGSVGAASTRAPDDYPRWSHWTYEAHMAYIKELWAEVRPQLKRDLKRVEFIDVKLQEMFAAFNAGDKEARRKAVWEIYNLQLENLR